MRDVSSDQNDQSKWISFLIRSVDQAEVAKLQSRIKAPGTAPCGVDVSTSGRLLALYINRARERQDSDCQRARAAAAAELVDIRDRLGARADVAAVVPPVVVPVVPPEKTAPVAAPIAPPDMGDPGLDEAIRLTYRMALKRAAADGEVQIWLRNFRDGVAFHQFLLTLHQSEEAQARRGSDQVGAEVSDGEFIVDLFRTLRGRGCSAHEVDLLRARLESGSVTRAGLLSETFDEVTLQARHKAEPVLHDGLSCAIMGTGKVVTLEDWQQKARDTEGLAEARAALDPVTPFVWPSEPGIRVSAIASLYCGGDFIEQFMDNITGQTGFDRHCELIIIDAESPENEGETITRYLERHPSIVYQRKNSRIGIYEAWNVGVDCARGRYLTNTNLDDLRRADSLEIQAGALDAMPFADVVYQDFYTTFDPSLDWEEVAAFGYKSDLPVITAHNMLQFNSPHNAPMWRKALHDELGLFDASLKSAGDYEFWMRCLNAGKSFIKVNEPHVVYYQNPKGLSTRADTRGLVEAHAITRKYGAQLMPPAMTHDYDRFLEDIGLAGHTSEHRNRYLTAQAGLRNLARSFKGAS